MRARGARKRSSNVVGPSCAAAPCSVPRAQPPSRHPKETRAEHTRHCDGGMVWVGELMRAPDKAHEGRFCPSSPLCFVFR
ncbi:hypothetical protein NDU88_003417 [Pleurodeles waltl]|uniref:Uncharacterized protein n=1 Tax=Pleurodeles waltl TaxID=8319 RepID=A0AAV7UDN1_PLEWA|nr:hypothetical protein NDU88_003417 [Pleurodeles waltl]